MFGIKIVTKNEWDMLMKFLAKDGAKGKIGDVVKYRNVKFDKDTGKEYPYDLYRIEDIHISLAGNKKGKWSSVVRCYDIQRVTHLGNVFTLIAEESDLYPQPTEEIKPIKPVKQTTYSDTLLGLYKDNGKCYECGEYVKGWTIPSKDMPASYFDIYKKENKSALTGHKNDCSHSHRNEKQFIWHLMNGFK